MERIINIYQQNNCLEPSKIYGYHQEWQNIFNFIILIPNKYIINILNFKNDINTVIITNKNIDEYILYLDTTHIQWEKDFLIFYKKSIYEKKDEQKYFKYLTISLLIYHYNNFLDYNNILRWDMYNNDYNISFSANFFYFYQWYLIFSCLLMDNDLKLLEKPLKISIIDCQQYMFNINKVYLNSNSLSIENRIDISDDIFLLTLIKNPNTFFNDIYRNLHWGQHTLGYDNFEYWNNLSNVNNGINIISLSTGSGSSEISFIIFLILYLKIKIDKLYVCDIKYEEKDFCIENIKCLKKTGLVNNIIFCKNILQLYNIITDRNHLQLEFSPYLGSNLRLSGGCWIKIQNYSEDIKSGEENDLYYKNPKIGESKENLKKKLRYKLKILSIDKTINPDLIEYIYILSNVNIRKYLKTDNTYEFSLKYIKDNFIIIGNIPLFVSSMLDETLIRFEHIGVFQILDILTYNNVRDLISTKTKTPFIKYIIYEKEIRKDGIHLQSGANSHKSYNFEILNYHL